MSSTANVDSIVVGGGSAGAVVAARLSEDPTRRVLLLEAGPAYAPAGYPPELESADAVGPLAGHDWGYTTEPGYIGHPMAALRGKVLGGSSAVNASIAVRPLRADFDRWSKRGLHDWAYQDLLPWLTALEKTRVGDDASHGRSGPLPIHQHTLADITPMQRAFVDAAVSCGVQRNEDFNGPVPMGVGPLPRNIIGDVRVNTAMAYLTEEVRARANLQIRGGVLVDRVLVAGHRAIGVHLADGTHVHASEVILSAGAYGSPAILLRSGIGPAADLHRFDIPVAADLPVGQALQDHPFYFNTYAVDPERIGASTPVVAAMAATASSLADPDTVDINITATHQFDPASTPTGAGITICVGMMRPASIGSLTLTSRDPAAAPRIDLNLLAEHSDRARMLEGIALCRRICASSPLRELIVEELNPGPDGHDDAGLLQSMLTTLSTYNHPTSTAPMGSEHDPASVTNHLGAVHGIEGLRVIDASLLPDIPSAPPHLMVIAAAEYLAHHL